MPQWRKLHTRITQSLDLNDMPDDFHRLLWSWLPLGLDREGRILDNAALVKAKVMPLREDVSLEQVQQALDWYAEHGADEAHPERTMIVRYAVNGRGYFYVPSFPNYQGRRGREAPSIYPMPPRQEQVAEEVTELVQEQVTELGSDRVAAQNRIRIESEQNRIESEQNQNRGASRSRKGTDAGLRSTSDLISSLSASDSDLTRPKRGPPLTDAARVEHAIQIRERAEPGKLSGREEAQMRQWATQYGPAVLYEATSRAAFKKPNNFGAYLRKTLEQIGKSRGPP